MERTQGSRPPYGESTSKASGRLRSVDGALQQSGDKRIDPLVNISGSRESVTELERQSVMEGQKRFSSTILALQEERDKVGQQFQDEAQRRAKQNQFSDNLLRDLNEMGKALANSRQAAKAAKRQLAQKEAEVEQLLNEKRAILQLIIEAGPWALWDWIKKEIVEQGLEPSEDFERKWLAWLAAAEDARISSSVPPCEGLASGKLDKDNADIESACPETHQFANSIRGKDTSTGSNASSKTSLLRTVFSIILQEGMVNLQYVPKKGLFFLPMAWVYFWMGLYSRITWHLLGTIASSLGGSFRPFRFHVI